MQVLKYSVGIDISKKTLDVCFSVYTKDLSVKVKGTRSFPNTKKGFGQLREWTEKHRKDETVPLSVVMEATGVYHENVAHYLHSESYGVSVVLPGKVKAYFKSLGIRSKTDNIDRRGLARLGAERKLALWTPPSKGIMDLRSLYRYKDMLEKELTQFRNRLHALEHSFGPNPFVIKELKGQIESFGKRAAKAEKEIGRLLEEQSDFNERARLVAGKLNGVGVPTVAIVAAETNGFLSIGSISQLTSYAGYDIVENQSGNRRGKTSISKSGNSRIRKALYFPALNVVRLEVKTFSDLYERVFDRSKIKMKGYVAVQRKLLCLIYTLWKKNEAFDPGHENPHKEKG